MLSLRPIHKNVRGDTILEVLISVAVLSLILSTSYALANRSTQANRQAAERSEAFKNTESQMESLKAYVSRSDNPALPPAGSKFCMKADNTPTSTITDNISNPTAFQAVISANPELAVCKSGEFFYTYIQRGPDAASGIGDNTFIVYTRWFNASATGVDQATMVHRIYPDLASQNDNISTVTTCLVGQMYDPVAVSCSPCPGMLTSTGGQDTTCECPYGWRLKPAPPANQCEPIPSPLPATASPSPYRFESWHLYNTGGTKPSRVFTFTHPNGTQAPLRTTNASISGNTSSFTIISNNCASRTLNPGSSCTVTVQFYPPSGGGNHRIANAGDKTATLTLGNSDGVAQTNVSMVGRAFAELLGPGDELNDTTTQFMWVYNMACYKNVEACGNPYTGIAGNGNLYLGGTYCAWGGWGGGGYGNYTGGNKLVMQGDGNLVFYDPYSYRYASWTFGGNYWMRLASDGGVHISSGQYGPVVKWIHYGGSCFAW